MVLHCSGLLVAVVAFATITISTAQSNQPEHAAPLQSDASIPYGVAFGGSLERQTMLIQGLHRTAHVQAEEALAQFRQEGGTLTKTNLWEFLPVTYNCPVEERTGVLYDGGKWLCGKRTLLQAPGCVIYSLGSNGEIEFEQEMLDSTACTVHTFDPSLTPEKMARVLSVPGVQFHNLGISAFGLPHGLGWNMSTLPAIMQDLGHEWVDVLKMDVEGSEWEVFLELLRQPGPLPFTQLQVELHLNEGLANGHLDVALDLLRQLDGRGLRMFQRELNACGESYVYEAAYIQVDEKGAVVGRPSLAGSPALQAMMGSSMEAQQRFVEEAYQISVRKLVSFLTIPVAKQAPHYCDQVWMFVSGTYSCPLASRLGSLGDGGAWVCGLPTLLQHDACVVYSFGPRDQSAVQALAAATTCQVHLFDYPDADSIARVRLVRKRARSALRSGGGTMALDLAKIMAKLEHGWLDLLRVDATAPGGLAEISGIFERFQKLPVTQLQLRVGVPDASNCLAASQPVFQLVEQLRARHLRMTHWEPVINATTGAPSLMAELSFIQIDATGNVAAGAAAAKELLGGASMAKALSSGGAEAAQLFSQEER